MGLGKELYVRVNPNIVVDVEVTGGSLKVFKVPRLGRVRLSAGSLKCRDVQEVADGLVQAGAASFEGQFSQGKSKIRMESGSLTVRLSQGADVRVGAEAQLGKISWPDDQPVDEFVMGAGRGKLDITVVMGFVSIKTGEEEEAHEHQN
jgi:hypothetical protein